jgi:hypothetical protein
MGKEAALKDLRASLRGAVLMLTDAGYEEARRVHNGMFTSRPAVIARYLGTSDVIDAVRFPRMHGLELAVRVRVELRAAGRAQEQARSDEPAPPEQQCQANGVS